MATHTLGLHYGKGNQDTLDRIKSKFERQQAYADEYLDNFPDKKFMFWSPYVPEGILTEGLNQNVGLELIINKTYTARVDALREQAQVVTGDLGNPFFRTLQILERLKK